MILFVGLSTVFFMIYQISSSYIPEGVSCSPREAKSGLRQWTHLRHRRRLRVWSACPLFMRLAICKLVDFGLDRGWDLCLGEFLVKWGEFSIWQVSKPPKHLFNILAVAWISVWWSFHCMFFSIVLIYRKRWMSRLDVIVCSDLVSCAVGRLCRGGCLKISSCLYIICKLSFWITFCKTFKLSFWIFFCKFCCSISFVCKLIILIVLGK